MISLKNELKTSKSRLFFIFAERVDILAEARIFFLILLSRYSFFNIPPWEDIGEATMRKILKFHVEILCIPQNFG